MVVTVGDEPRDPARTRQQATTTYHVDDVFAHHGTLSALHMQQCDAYTTMCQSLHRLGIKPGGGIAGSPTVGNLSRLAAAHDRWRPATDKFDSRLGLTAQAFGHEFLFWLDADGARAYPAFQFSDGRLLPGVTAAAEAFAIDQPWMHVAFMLTGTVRLDRRHLINVLREGRIGQVTEAVRRD